jgi:hypothetical protein
MAGVQRPNKAYLSAGSTTEECIFLHTYFKRRNYNGDFDFNPRSGE